MNLIEKTSVLCGSSALANAGLITYSAQHFCIMTSYNELDNLQLVILSYQYHEHIDMEHWVHPHPENPLLLVPTKERALVEYILDENHCDEGILIEAMKSYLYNFRDDKELRRVAEFFGLSNELLDYWIDEALNDEDD